MESDNSAMNLVKQSKLIINMDSMKQIKSKNYVGYISAENEIIGIYRSQVNYEERHIEWFKS